MSDGSSEHDDRETLILTLAPSGRDARLAEQALTSAGLACHICADLDELSREIAAGTGAVLIAGEALTPVRTIDPDVWLGPEPPWSQLPIVVLTGDRLSARHGLSAVRRLEQRKNATFLQRPVPRVTLISTLRAALESRRRQYVVRDLLMQLQDNVRQRDDFLATLGHELRNPLAAIRAGAAVLRLQGDKPGTAGDSLDIVERNILHMVRLIDDLLDVSRITMGKIALKREQTDLGLLVRRAVDASRVAGADTEQVLTVDLPDEPVVLHADSVRLGQIVNNLLDNAMKYTDPGQRQIRVSVRRDGACAVLSVRDNGLGLSRDSLDHVFRMFTQVDSRRTDGLGIGLALARGLVEMHGGSIEARSDGLGRGSEFIVRLPLTPQQSERENNKVAGGLATLAGHRVLVVDDNRDAADAVGRLLEAMGADARVTYGGPAALEELGRFRATAVLLDIDMPGMDGYEVSRRIRAREDMRDCLLIAVTGWGHSDLAERAADARLDHYLIKPIRIDDLQKLLATRTVSR